jgi:cystathionine beta-lyase/cystathionine gamma-synthase
MEKHEKNAQAIVEILSNNAKVKSVFYPGLAHHPSHEIAKKTTKWFWGNAEL